MAMTKTWRVDYAAYVNPGEDQKIIDQLKKDGYRIVYDESACLHDALDGDQKSGVAIAPTEYAIYVEVL